MADNPSISKIIINGITYDVKDTGARNLIGTGKFVVSTDASTTPQGVSWYKTSTSSTITGNLAAAAERASYIYLVPEAQNEFEVQSDYSEYIIITTDNGGSYIWEKIGSTSVDLTGVVMSAILDKAEDSVLGAGTTITVPSSTVSFGTTATDSFVKSYPGVTSKLNTTQITGTNGTESVSKVTETGVTATKTVIGEDKTASYITTASMTATNLILDDPTTASKATAGEAYSPITSSLTATIYSLPSSIGNTDSAGVVYNMHVSDETLSFSTVATTTTTKVVHTPGTTSITPYTFADVAVPVVTSNTPLTFNAVDTNVDISVQVISTADVSASKVTVENVNVAKVASSAITVATGTLSSDGSGAAVMTGLGTASTATAVTAIPTGTVAQQDATVDTNDLVNALTNATKLDVSKHQ